MQAYLTKLLMDILGTSLILDIDNAELHFEEVVKGKYERTCACHTMKTTWDLKSFVLRSI